jgi:hypothetical protein
MDAVDSGFSIDNIDDLKGVVKELIIPEAKNYKVEIYIIASANTYELARGEKCIDVRNAKYVTFKDYEDYRKFILRSYKAKFDRYERYNRKLKNKGET